MARQRTATRRRPATSPEQREMQVADAAYDLAEEQINAGTASSQVLTYFLKMGSTRERLEQERMRHEVEMMIARKEQLEGQKRIEELFADAIGAFRGYSGAGSGAMPEFDEEGEVIDLDSRRSA